VVHVALVGRLRIGAGGQWLDDAELTRHDRLVLAFLIVERARRVSREELADLVWEDRVPASWKTALRGVVSRIRTALAGVGLVDVLTTGPGWYELRLPEATMVDIESADADLVTSVRLLAEGDPAGTRDSVGSALEVARQPFLPGVHALWVEQRQELLEDLRLRALEVVADAALASADWPAARRRRLLHGRAPGSRAGDPPPPRRRRAGAARHPLGFPRRAGRARSRSR